MGVSAEAIGGYVPPETTEENSETQEEEGLALEAGAEDVSIESLRMLAENTRNRLRDAWGNVREDLRRTREVENRRIAKYEEDPAEHPTGHIDRDRWI